MKIVRCYDRYAPVKRLLAVAGLGLGLTMGLLASLPARAAEAPVAALQAHRLPTVVISGRVAKAPAPLQRKQLPTVVISARRSLDGQQIAQR
jgi:hypothetical protein